MLLGWALVSCGGLTDDLRSESSDGVAPGQADDEQPREPVGDEPVEEEPVAEEPATGGTDGAEDPASAGGAASESAGGASSEPEDACSDVCQTLEDCAEEPLAECHERCEQSFWVEAHDVRCLALRVYWINEEGCGVMLDTYEHFEPDDDCAD